MKKALLVLVIAAGAFLGWEGYQMVTDRMKGPRWDNLIPELKQKTMDLLYQAKKAGLDVMFYDGWRSVEDEQAHIANGSSKLKDPYNTHHLWGSAVDIVFRSALGQPYWPDASDPRWAQLITIGESLGLKHPIFWDKPHFELSDFSIVSVRNEYGTDYQAYLADNGVIV